MNPVLNAADGIMIARGDLGVEVLIERIAAIQKALMRQANEDAGQIIVPSGGKEESGPGLLELEYNHHDDRRTSSNKPAAVKTGASSKSNS